MKLKTLIFSIALLLNSLAKAQITTDPELPSAVKKVTITFNSAEESRLGYFTGDLYAHTGVTIKGEGRWQNVIGNWGENDKQPQLNHVGNGIYTLEISPDINSFYNVSSGDKVTEICLVFRSADNSQQTADMFVKVYEEGLSVEISTPSNNAILPVNEAVSITAVSTLEAQLKLFLNETELATTTGTSISTDHIFDSPGDYWIIAEATADSTVRDSVFIEAKNYIQTIPENYVKGVNYTSDTSVALVLWAPLKTSAHVIGDFNNWQTSDDYLMRKDGDFFWLELPNLEKGKEYAYQFFIDADITIADPYTEKILDENNDPYISESVYPGLKTYPSGKTEGIVSVFQTAQEAYNWEITDFELPENEKMIIYELLIRDFTEEHTYASIIEKLDYLEDLNINVLELMPVNEFEGNSSWGYNPAFYFAPDKYYGPKNQLKSLIDECHKRGIAVVIDMVLNHSYGQSPFVQMYMDSWTILPENPWYNVSSPNPTYSWGYDFNHESDATKELVDSVNSFWINEYKVDGFRFDFTKGFTNTPGDGSGYDQSRINILKRMANEIWKRNPDALVILEHFTGNTEEMALADHGMMIWGNKNYSYGETAMGFGASLYDAIAENRGWEKPNLVTYMESHDEERLTYNCVNFGASEGDYNTRDFSTAMDRLKLNSVFFILLPGPKMIWQFGELGYDYSINHCPDGSISEDCRTSEKPLVWDYIENPKRTALFQVMAKLNELKQTYEEFSPSSTEYSLANQTKWYKLSNNDNHVVGLGNFDISQNDIDITFPLAGKYYEFFSGDSVVFDSPDQSFTFQPGEYRLYSTRKFHDPDIETSINDGFSQNTDILVYPNPAKSVIHIKSENKISTVDVYSASGTRVYQSGKINDTKTQIHVCDFLSGIYFAKIEQSEKIIIKKFVVK